MARQAEPLDAAAMQQAAACLVGRHDFAAFAGEPETPRGEHRPHRCIDSTCGGSAGWSRSEAEADAFLPHQVRRTVGAAGRGGTGPADAAVVRSASAGGQARPAAGPAAPPQGLCLMRVTYPDLDFGEETDIYEDIQP